MGNIKLYSPSEIQAKSKGGITTRQILDLSEKGIIRPARETTGPGSPRLYDHENIFDICVCLALRGKFPPGGDTLRHIQEILTQIKRPIVDPKTGEVVDEIEYLYIQYNDAHHIGTLPIYKKQAISMGKSIQWYFQNNKDMPKEKPQHFCTLLLEIGNLRSFLKDHFW